MNKIFIFIFSLFFSACSLPIFMQEIKPKKTQEKIIEKPVEEVIQSPKVSPVANIVFKKPSKPHQEKEPSKEEGFKKPEKNPLKNPIKNSRKDIKNLLFKKIAFIGDSHIASDYIPHFFRKDLGLYSLGFIPAILPKWHGQFLLSYEHTGFKTEYLINTKTNLSFGGINAACLNTCVANINLSFYAKNPEYIEFKNNLWQIKSLNHQHCSVINLSVKNAKLGGFISNNDAYIDNLGINGASVFNYFRINEELEEQIAKKLAYDLVIFSFGTNESVLENVNIEKFKENYKKIINIFKKQNAKIILLIPPEPVFYTNGTYIKGKNNENIEKAIASLAKELNCEVFNINTLMQKEGGKSVWIEQGKSLKNAHLSKKGYDYVAKKLLDFIKERYER